MGIEEKLCPVGWWCPGVSMGMVHAWEQRVPRMELVPRGRGCAQGMGSCPGDGVICLQGQGTSWCPENETVPRGWSMPRNQGCPGRGRCPRDVSMPGGRLRAQGPALTFAGTP